MEQNNRRNILADLLTVYANAGKTIVFTQTKREADDVAAGIAGVIPSEVITHHSHMPQERPQLWSSVHATFRTLY